MVHGINCIGHGQCAAACPVSAITLVFGDATRGIDLPELNQHFETSRPGVHVVGELGGMGLIRNAIEQGAQCASYLAGDLSRRPRPHRSMVDVVVVGAGPAGVSCALALHAKGLSVKILDQVRAPGAMANFPRHGLMTDGPIQLPGAGRLHRPVVGKEELISYFEEALDRAGQRVEAPVRVTGLSGLDGEFQVETDTGRIAARKVVLAVGRRGAPRRLGVPGEDLPKVTASLIDAEQYRGASVLVVGGGDAAVDAASRLAESGDGQVTLCHRGLALTRCRPASRERALDLVEQGRLRLALDTEVLEIEPRRVRLRSGGGEVILPNDFVIACLGGEVPLQFLSSLGVQVRRHFGEALGATRSGPGDQLETVRGQRRARPAWHRGLMVAGGLGLGLLAVLTWMGWDYYRLAGGQRLLSPLHRSLRPAGSLGLTIGIAAAAVMLTNFLYALRKRWSVLAGVGDVRRWLDVHVLVGVMSPVVIAFHAAFQSNNLLATGTFTALGIVVATGLIGRYFYALVPGSTGEAVELADLLGQSERVKSLLRPLLAGAATPGPLEALLAEASARPSPAPFAWKLLRSLPEAVAFRFRLAASLRLLKAADRGGVRDGLLRLQRLRAQAGLFGGIKRLMRAWRSLHASLAILLVIALIAHISVSVYLGFGPDFSRTWHPSR
jgi:thioredoxin reductase